MRVWFNRQFALVHRVLQLIRDADTARRFTLLCSHKDRYFAGYAAAHEHAVEPTQLPAADYVSWCLDFALTHHVDVFVPAYQADAILAAQQQFSAAGISVLAVADARTLPRLHDKAWVYERLASEMPLPAWTRVQRADELMQAVQALWEQGHEACIKPIVSIYGKGFHRLMRPDNLSRPRRGLTIQEWLARQGTPLTPQLALEYLPGHEYSVDCIGDAGRLVTGVVRKKAITSKTQLLENNPQLLREAARVLDGFAINGLVNVQFKTNRDGQPRLLEINPRPSGGVAMSCLSGVNLPWLALCGALDGFDTLDIPEARLGIRVTEVSTPVVLPSV